MLKALWDVTQQFQNKNGSILTSGKIYIYYQGRTALATTYHDEDGTVVNSNPVLLDNNGRATVFASPMYSYTIVVCDYYGQELFSQDITIHDAVSVAKDVLVLGTDGTVLVDTENLPNGVKYDLSVNTDIIATKKSVDDVKTDLNNLTEVVNTHTTEIGQIKEDVQSIDSKLNNKKDKQPIKNFNGSATKTIKNISQNANGELTVEFEDIDLPQEVPNIEIESNTLLINSNIDPVTNTKTFTIELEGSELDYYNAGQDKGTVVSMNNNSLWLPLANQNNLYGAKGITLNSEYTRANLDPNKKYLCVAEVHWDVNNYNIANTVARLSLNYQIGQRTSNPLMTIEIDMSRENEGYRYMTWLTEGADWTGIYANLTDNKGKAVRVSINHFIVIELSAITSGGTGGGSGDNDKVAIDANAIPGYLEDVLVSDTDIVSLVKLGNKLHIQVNTAYTADPKLATCDEAVINGATANYGSYNLNSGYDKLIWNDPNSYAWLNASVQQMKRLCTSQGTVTKCNLAICGSLSLTTPPAFINCGIFDTNGTLLGSTGLRLYGTDFFSGSELVSFDMSEAFEGALKLKHNTYYIIQIITCGLQLASLSHADSYNYNYDYDLRMNLQGTTSEVKWKDINALSERASQIPWISFAASPNV